MWTKFKADLQTLWQTRRTPLIVAALIILAALLWPAHHARHKPERDRGDIAGFTRACVAPALRGERTKSACQSLAGIEKSWHVDARAELVAAQGARIETARRIARGDLTTDKQYQDCLAQGDCAAVPLQNRAQFWHLVNSGGITAADCAALPICQAMVKLHLMVAPPPLGAP